MGASVRDTFEKDQEKQYLSGGSSPSDFRWGNKAHAMRKNPKTGRWEWRFSTDYAVRAAEILRENGRPGARAYGNSGELLDSVEPTAASPSAQIEAAYTTATARDGSCRQVPPIRKTPAGYFIDYNVHFNGQWNNGSIQGRTPNEAIEKLFLTGAAIYECFVATLPLAEAPAEVAPATVDLSGLTPLSEKEYQLAPAADFRAGGRYYTDPVFQRRVDLLKKKWRDETARRAQDEANGL